jgi:hypothetical protein
MVEAKGSINASQVEHYCKRRKLMVHRLIISISDYRRSAGHVISTFLYIRFSDSNVQYSVQQQQRRLAHGRRLGRTVKFLGNLCLLCD